MGEGEPGEGSSPDPARPAAAQPRKPDDAAGRRCQARRRARATPASPDPGEGALAGSPPSPQAQADLRACPPSQRGGRPGLVGRPGRRPRPERARRPVVASGHRAFPRNRAQTFGPLRGFDIPPDDGLGEWDLVEIDPPDGAVVNPESEPMVTEP
ncbi:hypothetical protein NL676_010892 [Syzygium grande]|nr:hypothetical protein NL676_010892 [Syzygium grande]